MAIETQNGHMAQVPKCHSASIRHKVQGLGKVKERAKSEFLEMTYYMKK